MGQPTGSVACAMAPPGRWLPRALACPRGIDRYRSIFPWHARARPRSRRWPGAPFSLGQTHDRLGLWPIGVTCAGRSPLATTINEIDRGMTCTTSSSKIAWGVRLYNADLARSARYYDYKKNKVVHGLGLT
jgi:hypothetical protein